MSFLFGPKPQSPAKTIAQQQSANQVALGQSLGTRPSFNVPGLSVTQGFDPSGNPLTNFGLSQENQDLYNQVLGIRGGIGSGLGALVGNAAGILSQPFDMTQAGMNAALGGAGLIESMNRPFWNAQSNWLDTRLRNQGLVPGQAGDESNAYGQQMRQLLNNQFLQYQNAVLPWQSQAANQALQSYQSIPQTISQLMGFTGPSFPVNPAQWQVSPTYNTQAPNVGQIQANYQNAIQQYYNNIANVIGGLGSGIMAFPFGSGTIGSAIGTGIGGMFGIK